MRRSISNHSFCSTRSAPRSMKRMAYGPLRSITRGMPGDTQPKHGIVDDLVVGGFARARRRRQRRVAEPRRRSCPRARGRRPCRRSRRPSARWRQVRAPESRRCSRRGRCDQRGLTLPRSRISRPSATNRFVTYMRRSVRVDGLPANVTTSPTLSRSRGKPGAVEARQVRALDFPELLVAVDGFRADLKAHVRVAPQHADDLAARFDERAGVVLGRRMVRRDRHGARSEPEQESGKSCGEPSARVVLHCVRPPHT